MALRFDVRIGFRMCKGGPEDLRFPGSNYSTHSAGGCGAGLPTTRREQGLQGSVGLYLLVTDSGQVKLVRISDSSGYDILDNAAIQYAKRLQFHPASRRGKPTSIWLTWRVDYRLQLREPRFVADKFFEELSRQMRLAEQTSGRKRDRILQKILDYQQKYVRILDEEAGRNFNGYVRKLVRAEVSEYWPQRES